MRRRFSKGFILPTLLLLNQKKWLMVSSLLLANPLQASTHFI